MLKTMQQTAFAILAALFISSCDDNGAPVAPEASEDSNPTSGVSNAEIGSDNNESSGANPTSSASPLTTSSSSQNQTSTTSTTSSTSSSASTSTSTPTPNATPQPTVTKTCRGKLDSGHCWYIAGQSQSCAESCSVNNLGPYDEATKTLVGSSGTDAECKRILQLFLNNGEAPFAQNSDITLGSGCYYRAGGIYRNAAVETLPTHETQKAARLCSCQN